MNTQQPDKYAQMQSKLEEGIQMLAHASDDDSYILGIALIKIHGALEDFVRLEIVKRAPSLRMEVADPSRTNWKDLIHYGRLYLRFTDQEIQMINEANHQRQRVAHGGNYEKSRAQLAHYADFVQRWCQQGKPASTEVRLQHVTILRKPYKPPSASPPSISRPVVRSWHQSRMFFFLVFFLLPPVWAILMLSDRRQGWLVHLIAGTLLTLEVFAVVVLFNPSVNLIPGARRLIEQEFGVPFSLPEESPTAIAVTSPSPSADEILPVSTTDAVCSVVWLETSAEELAGKNRAMVWEEVVMSRVEGSGMTPRQFYDLVLEHNPELVRDGYEFKQGKTYLLPECE